MRRIERATPKSFEPVVSEHEIRPKLRFLLSEEAKAEGRQMARNFRGYVLSRPRDDTRCQFEALVSGIREGRYPHIAAADEIMSGFLIASLQKIADGFRQPETMIWYQSWAAHLENGRPDLMHDAAVRMMTPNERWLPRIIDDENDALPKTAVDAVRAGGGTSGGRDEWVPSNVAIFRRYRDFIEYLQDWADGDDTARLVNSPAVTKAHTVYLALKPGQNGGLAFVAVRKGTAPASKGLMTVRLDPTVTGLSLAAALSTEPMMVLARRLLAPGAVNPADLVLFADGLKDLRKVPFGDVDDGAQRPPPVTKPPSLAAEIWHRIPREKRRDYLTAMARGLRRGVHPDETAEELLAAEAA